MEEKLRKSFGDLDAILQAIEEFDLRLTLIHSINNGALVRACRHSIPYCKCPNYLWPADWNKIRGKRFPKCLKAHKKSQLIPIYENAEGTFLFHK